MRSSRNLRASLSHLTLNCATRPPHSIETLVSHKAGTVPKDLGNYMHCPIMRRYPPRSRVTSPADSERRPASRAPRQPGGRCGSASTAGHPCACRLGRFVGGSNRAALESLAVEFCLAGEALKKSDLAFHAAGCFGMVQPPQSRRLLPAASSPAPSGRRLSRRTRRDRRALACRCASAAGNRLLGAVGAKRPENPT